MKRILFLLLATAFCTLASAQAIRDIETTVYLYKNGNAMVVQTWDLNVTKGTEWYIPIDNPGKSRITDFCVFENDEKFADDGDQWDSSRSIEEKAQHSGIVRKSGNDIELCWGLGSMGDHTFTILYVIRDLVQSYKECDGFHWHFLNDEWSVKPQHASITFINETEGDAWYWKDKDTCNVRFWGFGMIGDSGIEDGVIKFESTEPFQYQSFFSAMIQFDKGLFEPKVEADKKWKKVQKEAFKGSDYKKPKRSFDDIMGSIIEYGLMTVGLLAVLFFIYMGLSMLYWKITGKRYEKSIFGQNKIEGWWRDIPLGGSPTALFSILNKGDKLAFDYKKGFPNLVSAYFLKWIQEGLLAVEKDPEHDDRVNLRFVKGEEDVHFDDSMEEKIYLSAREASGHNLLLEKNEFKSWSYKHDTTVLGWPDEAINVGQARWESFSQDDRRHAVEFRNFLRDFTLVDQRQAPEVGVWKQYMILASALGIADQVARNFEKLFPKIMEEYTRQSNMTDAATTYLILRDVNESSTAMVASALKRDDERKAAEAAERRSSGGGGSISFGGGGGGFGGGHGGGAR